jgi:hypothetical protein
MTTNDPLKYYSILGLSSTATDADIKAAFRRRAMELHPDRNRSTDATQQFQLLNAAYSVLNDPESRARYDMAAIEAEQTTQQAEHAMPEPIVCKRCNKVTAQPRYVVFLVTKSFIVITYRSVVQGIFCSSCAEKTAIRATLVTWLLGWWGIPWGPVYSIQSLFTNLFGGKKMATINAQLAAHQAWCFAMMGKTDMARAIAADALGRVKEIKPGHGTSDSEINVLRAKIESLVEALGGAQGAPQLNDSWSLFRRPFYVQGGLLFTVISAIALLIAQDIDRSPISMAGSGPRQESNQYIRPVVSEPFRVEPTPYKTTQATYVRPERAPNNQPWPSNASYVTGYDILNDSGYSEVTIDNAQNNSDVFVKLVALNGAMSFPVRMIFIPAGRRFTLPKVTAGTYDIRYRALATGALSGSQKFQLEERETPGGVEYSTVAITLYKVRDGNFESHTLSESEF